MDIHGDSVGYAMTDNPNPESGPDGATDTTGSLSREHHQEIDTTDIHEEKAMQIVEQLLAEGTVEMPDDLPVLHHQPTGTVFESSVNLAHFHKGWILAQQRSASSTA
jgi:hypothetical protein